MSEIGKLKANDGNFAFIINMEKLTEEIVLLEQQLKTEFDTGYKLGVKEAKGEIDKLRKEIEQINQYIPNISTKALTTSEKLKIAVDCLEFYADLDEEVIQYDSRGCSEARQALEKIRSLNEFK